MSYTKQQLESFFDYEEEDQQRAYEASMMEMEWQYFTELHA